MLSQIFNASAARSFVIRIFYYYFFSLHYRNSNLSYIGHVRAPTLRLMNSEIPYVSHPSTFTTLIRTVTVLAENVLNVGEEVWSSTLVFPRNFQLNFRKRTNTVVSRWCKNHRNSKHAYDYHYRYGKLSFRHSPTRIRTRYKHTRRSPGLWEVVELPSI